MATLSLKNATKSFGNIDVIKGVDLDIADREFVVFVGPSGSGKSTLLRMIAGLEEITGGDLTIDGQRINDTPPDERGLAMVFQTYALYPHMNVRDNMGFALKLAGVAKAERESKVEEVAKTLQLDQLLDRKPKQLSGGSASALPSDARWCANRRYSCSTSRCPISMQRCACRCVSSWRVCTTASMQQ